MMQVVSWVLVACVFLQLCSADMNCIGTPSSQFADQTQYSASDAFRVKASSSGCGYSWNVNGTVIANQIRKNDKLVVNNSINDIITSECFDDVTFQRSCPSEGKSHWAHCRTNCTLNALIWSQKNKENDADAGTAGTDFAAIAAGAVGAAVLVLAVLCYKFRDRISRVRSCPPPRCIYTSVMKQNTEPNAADEEVGNE